MKRVRFNKLNFSMQCFGINIFYQKMIVKNTDQNSVSKIAVVVIYPYLQCIHFHYSITFIIIHKMNTDILNYISSSCFT